MSQCAATNILDRGRQELHLGREARAKRKLDIRKGSSSVGREMVQEAGVEQRKSLRLPPAHSRLPRRQTRLQPGYRCFKVHAAKCSHFHSLLNICSSCYLPFWSKA